MDQIYEGCEQGMRWTAYDRLRRKRAAYEGFTMEQWRDSSESNGQRRELWLHPKPLPRLPLIIAAPNRYKLQLETSAATGVALMRAQHTPTGPGPDRGETLVVQANGAVIPGESRP
jgi:hypothetical protein